MQIYYFSSKQQRNEEKKGLVIALGKVTTHLPIHPYSRPNLQAIIPIQAVFPYFA